MPGRLDDREKSAQLGFDRGGPWAPAAIACELEVHRGWKGVVFGRRYLEKVARLFLARSTQREEMCADTSMP